MVLSCLPQNTAWYDCCVHPPDRNILKALIGISIEFGPIVVFLFASEFFDFFTAASLFVGATLVALIAGYIRQKRVAWFPLIAGAIILVSGLLTIFLRDPFYLIIKDTIYNGVFAVVLCVGLALDKSFLKPLFGGLFAMTDRGWIILTKRWATMFVLLTLTNEIARATLTPNDWVTFKGIATLATIVFALWQFRLSKRERLPEATTWGMRR